MSCIICGKDLTKTDEKEYATIDGKTACVKHPGVLDLLPKEERKEKELVSVT